jgi:hypothetical protein
LEVFSRTSFSRVDCSNFFEKVFDSVAVYSNVVLVMTLAQFQVAVKAAQNPTLDLTATDDTMLFGYGLPEFKPVHTTIAAVAKVIRWQARQFNGQWDMVELDALAKLARRKFIIVD